MFAAERDTRDFSMTETAWNGGAIGAIFTPLWLPTLHDLSQAAAEIAPIMGVAALALNMALKLFAAYRGRV